MHWVFLLAHANMHLTCCKRTPGCFLAFLSLCCHRLDQSNDPGIDQPLVCVKQAPAVVLSPERLSMSHLYIMMYTEHHAASIDKP